MGGVGEVALCLRACAAFVEDPCVCTHVPPLPQLTINYTKNMYLNLQFIPKMTIFNFNSNISVIFSMKKGYHCHSNLSCSLNDY